jgi:teichuronic acid exporter
MKQGSTIRRGAAWVLAGQSGDKAVSFVVGIILARLLAPEEFGLLLTIQIFTGVAGLVSGGGMGQALVRAKSATKADYDIVFTLQLMIGCAIYGLFFATAPLFSRWYDNPVFVDLIRISALSFIFRPLINVPSNILNRHMRYKEQMIVGMVTLIISSLVSISMAYLGLGVWSLIWGGIIGAFVQSGLLVYRSGWRPGLSIDLGRGRDLAGYGFLVSANDIVDHVRSRICIFLLSQHTGPAAVGLYNKGESLAAMPFSFVSGSAYQVLFRAMATEQDNRDKCLYLFTKGILLVGVYATPLYIALLWLAEPLVRGVYGERWVEAAGPLFILVFAWPFWLLENMSGVVTAALNRLRSEVQIHIANLFVVAFAVMIALPFGINGVAWAMVGAAAFSSAFMYRLATRCLAVQWWICFRALGPVAILNAPLAATLFVAERTLPHQILDRDLLHVGVLALLGGLVYATCMLLLPIPALDTERSRWRKHLRLGSSN